MLGHGGVVIGLGLLVQLQSSYARFGGKVEAGHRRLMLGLAARWERELSFVT